MEVEEWLGKENQIGIDIFNKKYRNNGETFEAWLSRVSGGDKEVARLIREKKFLFGGRVLANRGLTETKVTYSNCYVIPIKDNIPGIFKAAGEIAETYSRGGGCGLNLSNLAPRGIEIHNAAKTSSGSLSFAEIYDMTTATIGQAGRRGALMLSISSEHPDLEEFINAKEDTKKLNHANLSVMVSDEFMQAVCDDDDYKLSFTRDTGANVTKTIKAREVFNKLVRNNWLTGEPGLLYWDEVKSHNMVSNNPAFVFEGTNPCSELPLPAYGACNLGSFNLAEYLTDDNDFDFEAFENDIPIVVKAMNGVLDEGLPFHPLEEQRETVAKWRMIGIGVMGFADMLISMGIKYGSGESIEYAKMIADSLFNNSVFSSSEIAEEHGSYTAYDNYAAINNEMLVDTAYGSVLRQVSEHGLRNATILAIAPTGTLSTLLGCSNGIEPIFATKYTRRTESLHGKSVSYEVYSQTVQKVVDKMGLKENDKLPDYVVTSPEIDPMDRIKMQATWQKYIDSAISSTINMPNAATEEDIYNIYIEAWKHNLKGVTVFRAGCDREGILSTGAPKISSDYIAPDVTFGVTSRVTTGCGHYHATVSGIGNTPLKVFISPTTGGCKANLEAIGRLTSLALRSGISPELVTKQLDKVQCDTCMRSSKATTKSCAAGISDTIKLMVGKKKETNQTDQVECPSCHKMYVKTSKCGVCTQCGFSNCS